MIIGSSVISEVSFSESGEIFSANQASFSNNRELSLVVKTDRYL